MTRKRRTLEPAAWYSIRLVRSRKPATYRCPLCGLQLHAMSDHVLIAPEGERGQGERGVEHSSKVVGREEDVALQRNRLLARRRQLHVEPFGVATLPSHAMLPVAMSIASSLPPAVPVNRPWELSGSGP